MSTTAQLDIGALLEMAGARIRGRNRADCPECKRPRAVSFNDTAFCCHGIDCGFHGGIGTLRQRLAIERQWLPKAEYIRQCRERERVYDAALRLYAVAHARQLELRDDLRILGRLEQRAHEMGADDPNTWEILSTVYELRPATERDLDVLESGSAKHIFEAVRSMLRPGKPQ